MRTWCKQEERTGEEKNRANRNRGEEHDRVQIEPVFLYFPQFLTTKDV